MIHVDWSVFSFEYILLNPGARLAVSPTVGCTPKKGIHSLSTSKRIVSHYLFTVFVVWGNSSTVVVMVKSHTITWPLLFKHLWIHRPCAPLHPHHGSPKYLVWHNQARCPWWSHHRCPCPPVPVICKLLNDLIFITLSWCQFASNGVSLVGRASPIFFVVVVAMQQWTMERKGGKFAFILV